MEISAQVARQLSQALQAQGSAPTGLKVGDSVTAQVLGKSSSGGTLLSVGNGQVSVNLANTLPPGTQLNLQVQSTANGLQFTLTSQTPPPANGTALPQAGAATQPQTATPQNVLPTASSALPTASAQPQSPAVVNSVTPTNIPQGVVQTTPPIVTQSAAPVVFTNLQAGATVTAQVGATSAGGQTNVTIAGQQVSVSLPAPAAAGATLTLQVQRGPDGLQLAQPNQQTATSTTTTTTSATSSTAQPASTTTAATTTAPSTTVPSATAAAAAIPVSVPALPLNALASLGNQNSVAALLSAVLKLDSRSSNLPPATQDAISSLKNAALQPDKQPISAQNLKTAVAKSGVFMEAKLTGAPTPQPLPGAIQAPIAPIAGDTKALLFLLKGSLAKWLGGAEGETSSKTQHSQTHNNAHNRPAHANAANNGKLSVEQQLGQSLLSKTDSALSRLQLLQLASMPDVDAAPITTKADWQVELPFILGQHATTLNLHISRDEQDEGSDPGERGWHMQFSLNAGDIGDIGAEVSFIAGQTSVVLWAEKQEALDAINADLPELTQALESQGLTVGAIRVRRPETDQSAAENLPGHFVDVGT